MQGEAQVDLLFDRLADHGPDNRAGDLVLAAAMDDESFHAALGGTPVTPPVPTARSTEPPPALFLQEIWVEGVRGIGPRTRLGLRPGPGLTLVVGRNGSGKSSFAEAAELALTGTASR